MELLIKSILALNKLPGIQVFGDNTGVVEGWWSGRSRNAETNCVFKRIHEMLEDHDSVLATRYVNTEQNPADGPSRGIYPPSHLLLPQLTSPTTSDLSSLTSTPLPNPVKEVLLNALLRRPRPTSPSPNKFDVTKPTPLHTSNHITPSKRLRLIDAIQNPNQALLPEESDDPPMNANLPRLSPSPLQPHCAATDHIHCWKPENARNTLDADGLPTNLNKHDLARIQQVLEEAYAPSTRSTYGTGWFTFHLFCDLKGIEERHRAPIDPIILTSFVASLTSIYGGDSIRNFVYSIRAWHIIHGVPWKVDNNTLQALFTAGRRLAPPDAKKEETKPWTTSYVT